jgi:hypothetical protein
MKYPAEFPAEVQDRIETEKIRAYRDLRVSPLVPVGLELFKVVDRCIMRIFRAYAKEACELRPRFRWTIERVDRDAEEFLRRLVITVVEEEAPQLRTSWLSDWVRPPGSATVQRLKDSPEWKEYEDMLLNAPSQTSLPAPAEPQGAEGTEPPIGASKRGRPRKDEERKAIRRKKDEASRGS